MLLTVTMNPSIDISYPLEHLAIDTVNRVQNERKTAGGKGLNVSRVAHLLGHEIVATGVLGGDLGHFIQARLDEDGVKNDFVRIEQESRLSIAILHDNGNQTEILEAGPTLTEQDVEAFLQKYDELLKTVDIVTLSGSLPGGVPKDFYTTLTQHAVAKNVKVILDASGDALRAGIEADLKPLLIKPNEEELAALLNVPVDKHDLPALKAHLQNPLFDGIEWIVVSLGSNGAFVKHNEKFYHAAIPKINVVNPVGSGDSTLAGLAVAIDDGQDDEGVMKTAMTTGMLNTMEAKTGWINPDLFAEYFAKVTVESV